MAENIVLRAPVVSGFGPEKHQGVYRDIEIQVADGTGTSYALMLSYIAQCWAKLHHQSAAEQGHTIPGAQGEGMIDTRRDKAFQNWQCSHALVEILRMPAGDDLVFGANPLVYVGRCAFFQSALSDNAKDWTLAPIQFGAGFSSGPQFNAPQAAVPQSFQELRQTLAQTARGQGLLLQASIQENNILAPRDYRAPVGTFYWGFTARTPKLDQQAPGVAGTYFYPLQWINFRRSIFYVPNPNASGFWWHFKPGVVANITLFGLQQDPEVGYGGGEVSGASYNPLKGGVQ